MVYYISQGGILCRDIPSDVKDMAERGYDKIDFVVCNLYPFELTVAKDGVTIPEAVEEVDIGGVTLLRAAAKNHERVTIISDPKDYPAFIKEIETTFKKDGVATVSLETRRAYALKAFSQTAKYDDAISQYFRKEYAGNGDMQLNLRYC